jgi:long-subunit fatty acid transport protein
MRALLGLALTVGVAPAAWANEFESLGFGPRAIGMGDAVTADANDYTAVWYNPAMLVTRKDLNFGASFNYQHLGSQVTTRDPTQQANLDCSHCTPNDTLGFSTGLLFPLGGKVKNRVAIGLGLYLPVERLLRTEAPDPNSPFWYLYTGSPERITVVGAVAVRITENFMVGVGLQQLADLVGSGANVQVDLFAKQVGLRQIDSHLAVRNAPIAGLMFQPLPQLRLGASYRAEMSLLYSIPARVNLTGIGQLDFSVQGLVHYSPHTFNAGVAYDVSPKLTLTLDGTFALWSRAPSPYLNLDMSLAGPTLTALGLQGALDIASPRQAPGFKNTLAGHAGMEYRWSDRLAARSGVFFRPTPVPRQDTAMTNILDADTLGVAAGVGFAFDDPLEVFVAPIHIDAAVQAAFLLNRSANKDTTADTVPPYTYAAQNIGASVAVRYDF